MALNKFSRRRTGPAEMSSSTRIQDILPPGKDRKQTASNSQEILALRRPLAAEMSSFKKHISISKGLGYASALPAPGKKLLHPPRVKDSTGYATPPKKKESKMHHSSIKQAANLKSIKDRYGSTISTSKLSPLEALDLSYTSRRGLPSSFFGLSRLNVLDLSYTSRRGLPSSFFGLSRLKVLDLSYTGIRRLPSSIYKLALLEVLNLSYTGIRRLPSFISKLALLEVLDLSYTGIRCLPSSISKLALLEVLDLSNTGIRRLPSSISKLALLKVLDLSYTGIRRLPSSISKLAQLKTLSLRGCKQFKQLSSEITQLQNIEKFDLDGTPVAHFPEYLNFPDMRSLLLGGNLDLMEMSPSFFGHMPLLNVLDLSRTSIHDLPISFFNLQELTEFYLKDCDLFMELPPEIGRLRNLKTLDLDGTQIIHLPNEIQELTNLESLSLSFSGYDHNSGHGKKCISYSSSAMIPLGFISKLTHLKDLRIDVNPDNEWWHENVECVLAEIVGLERLRTLHLYVPEVKLLKLILSPVSYFRFIVGHHLPRIISRGPPAVEVKFEESSRSLRFVNGMDFPNEVKNILQFAQAFFLDRHMTINSLSQFGLKNLRQLRSCILAECNEMQNIVNVDGKDSNPYMVFRLEFLTIFYMKNLRSIIYWPSPGGSIFFGLKFLALHTCPELTTVFTMHSLVNLVNLEELIVEDCPKVSSIISCQSSKRRAGTFLPRLRKLSLLYVPELVSISNGLHIGRNLEKIGFYHCAKLKSLSSAELSSEKLKVIRGESEWWEALKWSEADWGQEGRPDKFNRIFFTIDEELDVLTQLSTDEVESF